MLLESRRRWLRQVALGTAALAVGGLAVAQASPGEAASAGAVEVTELSALALSDGVWALANLRLELPTVVEAALSKGVAMHFVLELEVLRRRWYWADRSVAQVARHFRLSYQPLGRRWRLQQSPQSLTGAAAASAAASAESFDGLADSLRALERLGRLRLTEQPLDEVAGHYLMLRFRLDTAQLPRPLQIGALGRTDWSLATERTVPLVADLSRSGANLP